MRNFFLPFIAIHSLIFGIADSCKNLAFTLFGFQVSDLIFATSILFSLLYPIYVMLSFRFEIREPYRNSGKNNKCQYNNDE